MWSTELTMNTNTAATTLGSHSWVRNSMGTSSSDPSAAGGRFVPPCREVLTAAGIRRAAVGR
jgi:hypothetical protein